MGDRQSAAHIQLGASTRFWLAALAFVDELVARGCFAPYAGDDDSVLLAHGSPVFDAPAAARLRVLATAMPGVCRAARFTDDWQARAPDALPLLTGFIERLLDRRVRRRIRPMLFESLAGNDDTPATRWLSRLAGRATQAYLPVRSLAEHHFGEAVRAWLTPFHIAPQATGRLCVQLDAPERMIDDADDGNDHEHANHVFHFDRWWNPAVENQATDRAFASTNCSQRSARWQNRWWAREMRGCPN